MTWVEPDDPRAGVSPAAESFAAKPVSNAVDSVVGPVWLSMALVTGDWGVFSTIQSFIAHGAAAVCGLGAVSMLWRWREKLKQPATEQGSLGLDESRRRFIAEVPGAACVLVGGGGLVSGAFVEPFDLGITRYSVPIGDLPRGLNGIRIAFVSDTHLGPRIPMSYLKRAIGMTLDERPDLVLLGGDYVHAGIRYIEPGAAMFEPLVNAGIPTIGVLGNHDWYNGNGAIARRLSAIGVRMIDNARVYIGGDSRRIVTDSLTPSDALCIAGVGDLMMDRVEVEQALAGVPAEMPRLLLSHNPDVAELPEFTRERSPAAPRVDLMLSGHTHGGQIRVPGVGPLYVPSKFGGKYAAGLVKGPAFPVLISRGVGMSICPVRLGVPPEILVVTLTRA